MHRTRHTASGEHRTDANGTTVFVPHPIDANLLPFTFGIEGCDRIEHVHGIGGTAGQYGIDDMCARWAIRLASSRHTAAVRIEQLHRAYRRGVIEQARRIEHRRRSNVWASIEQASTAPLLDAAGRAIPAPPHPYRSHRTAPSMTPDAFAPPFAHMTAADMRAFEQRYREHIDARRMIEQCMRDDMSSHGGRPSIGGGVAPGIAVGAARVLVTAAPRVKPNDTHAVAGTRSKGTRGRVAVKGIDAPMWQVLDDARRSSRAPRRTITPGRIEGCAIVPAADLTPWSFDCTVRFDGRHPAHPATARVPFSPPIIDGDGDGTRRRRKGTTARLTAREAMRAFDAAQARRIGSVHVGAAD